MNESIHSELLLIYSLLVKEKFFVFFTFINIHFQSQSSPTAVSSDAAPIKSKKMKTVLYTNTILV